MHLWVRNGQPVVVNNLRVKQHPIESTLHKPNPWFTIYDIDEGSMFNIPEAITKLDFLTNENSNIIELPDKIKWI